MRFTVGMGNEGKMKVINSGSGGVYGLAFLGALVYFIQHATSFWEGVVGVLEAIVWPGVLVYKALEMLKM